MNAAADSNDPTLESWVDVPANSDFPVQNIPFGIFSEQGKSPRAATAIGDFVVDLSVLQQEGFFDHAELPEGIFLRPVLNDFFALGRARIRQVRNILSRLLRKAGDVRAGRVKELALRPMQEVSLHLPLFIRNYTDFYSSEGHASNVGAMFRDSQNPLRPNWKHMPVGYHGRASSIVVSGMEIRRPNGQQKEVGADQPVFGPSRKLDFELELAFASCRATTLGEPVTAAEAVNGVAGVLLLNDWSARDIQQWEYVPLGPFLGKNFATTISPWVVTLDALEPFRVQGPMQNPPVLPYLSTSGARNFDINLEARLILPGGQDVALCRTNSRSLYWSVDQQIAHHTINGCNMDVGDLFASGTISGRTPDSYGSLLELSWNGTKPIAMPDGSTRTFLQDGDTIVIRGFAQRAGVRIGFGSCAGRIAPALEIL